LPPTNAIMPQTIEAISHAKNAGVPLVVAINKIDLPAANVQKVKQDLLTHGVVLEEFGGTTLATPISAKTGQNVQELLDQILLQAELLDLKANPDRRAHGTVLEATLDPARARSPPSSSRMARCAVAMTSSAGSSTGACARCTTNAARRLTRGSVHPRAGAGLRRRSRKRATPSR